MTISKTFKTKEEAFAFLESEGLRMERDSPDWWMFSTPPERSALVQFDPREECFLVSLYARDSRKEDVGEDFFCID